MAGVSTMVKNFAGAALIFSDATTPTPRTLTVALHRGDLTLSPISEFLNELVYYDVRTTNAGVGIGAPVRPQLSFSAFVANIIGSTDVVSGTPLEFAHRKGAHDDNVSTLGAGQITAIDIRLSIEGTRWGDVADETIDCESVIVSADFAMAGDGNTLSFTGTILGNIVFTNDENVVTYGPFDI